MSSKISTYLFRQGHLWGSKDSQCPDVKLSPKFIVDSNLIRQYIAKNLDQMLYADLNIVSSSKNYIVNINTHRGSEVAEHIENLKTKLNKRIGLPVEIKIKNIDFPESHPIIIARKIGQLMKDRKDIKIAIKATIAEVLRTCQGISVECHGRMGSDKAKTYKKKGGNIPILTIDAEIQAHTEHVVTKTGINGVTVVVLPKPVHSKVVAEPKVLSKPLLKQKNTLFFA